MRDETSNVGGVFVQKENITQNLEKFSKDDNLDTGEKIPINAFLS